MKTRKKRAARFHSRSEALQAPTGNQGKAQEEVSSPHSASNPGRLVLYMDSRDPGAKHCEEKKPLPGFLSGYLLKPGVLPTASGTEPPVKERNWKYHVNLLLIDDPDSQTYHYMYIKHFSRLLGSRTKAHNASYVCNSCLNVFASQLVFRLPYSELPSASSTASPISHSQRNQTEILRPQ